MHRHAFNNRQRLLSGGRAAVRNSLSRWFSPSQRTSFQEQAFSSSGGPPDHDEAGERPSVGRRDLDEKYLQDREDNDRGPAPSMGRGRGAFSYFLKKHERSVDQHSRAVQESSPVERPTLPGGVSGQFDDAPGAGDQGRTARFANWGAEKGFDQSFRRDGSGGGSTGFEDDWVQNWFQQVESKDDQEGYEADWDLDDDEDDEATNLDGVQYSKDIWWVKDAEEFEEYKRWEKMVDQQEQEQKRALQEKFDQMKAEKLAEGGDVSELELPDIVITTDLIYTAPPGTATVDRARPLPRRVDDILESMALPEGLDVTPADPEYEQIVNYWTTISKNNTLNEKMKHTLLKRMATFIAKHRHNDGLQYAITIQNHSKKKRRARRATKP